MRVIFACEEWDGAGEVGEVLAESLLEPSQGFLWDCVGLDAGRPQIIPLS